MARLFPYFISILYLFIKKQMVTCLFLVALKTRLFNLLSNFAFCHYKRVSFLVSKLEVLIAVYEYESAVSVRTLSSFTL